MYLPKRFFFVLLLCVLAFSSLLFFVQEAYAQSLQDVFYPSVQKFDQVKKDLREQAKDGKVRVSGQETNNYLLTATFYNFANAMACTDPTGATCTTPTALGSVTQFIAMLYTHPPASGILYAYDVFQNAGLVKPAYAQGIGFAGLSPLLPLWKMTRNISYMVIILIMVAIGFMVIFRMHIDPKTVISVQAALPKIVLTLVLITLSYPIVGFMIDLMYLVMAILINIMVQGMGITKPVSEVQTYFMTADIGDLFKTVFSAGFSSFDDFFLPWRNWGAAGTNITSGIITGLGFYLKFFATFTLPKLLLGGFSIDLIFLTILLLGLLFTFIRLLLLLLNSYIQLLISLILGPLQLLAEAIPGRSAFTEWILNIIANLVVFPATVVILMFSEYLTQMNTQTALWAPPLVWVPMKETFTAFLGLGVIFLTPTLVAQIKKLFHPKPVLPLTAGTAFAPLTGTVQTGMGAASQFYYLSNMPGLNKLFGAKGPQHTP